MVDEFFTVTEAAEKLGVSPRTIQRYCKQGRLNHKWISGKRHKELRILPPISLDKLPGVKRRSPLNVADYVTRKDFDDITARLDREILKKDIRIDELKQEIIMLKSMLGDGDSGDGGDDSLPKIRDSRLLKAAESLVHEFEKVRPAERKLILKIASTLRTHDLFLKKMGMAENPEDS
ncbi:helix-turn-helix domain-containing protein [bacterium]|nr:helix-turn-helix domain-containing protein [bacterium]